MKIVSKINLYIKTVKYLKLKQIIYRLFYKLKTSKNIVYKGDYNYPQSQLKFDFVFRNPDSYIDNEFYFLNLKKKFNDIDWNYDGYGKLWTYNLNYFDFLNQKYISCDNGIRLIEDFISKYDSVKDGKEPYPVSIRGINWIIFISLNSSKIPENKLNIINRSLYNQYQLLNKNIEYHIMGNHLLENGFSLLFAAYYFSDNNFLKKAKKIICSELNEQVLNDGGHFELSPMYHQILLNRLLCSISLIKNNRWTGEDILELMLDKASLMLGWLHEITYEDGSIPMLNDSGYDIAPSTEMINEYASSLKILPLKIQLNDSGYRKFKNNYYECIVDVGKIGSDYQPGHAHADTFNFEIYIGGKPVIVDTGISTYEKNDRRQLERSTVSHNTVVIDGLNSSEVWVGFRVADRAEIIDFEEGEDFIKASHNGFKKINTMHSRHFEFENKKVVIIDKVKSKSSVKTQAFFHFYPEEKITIYDNKLIGNRYVINFENSKNISIEKYLCSAGFNILKEAEMVSVEFDKNLKTIIQVLGTN